MESHCRESTALRVNGRLPESDLALATASTFYNAGSGEPRLQALLLSHTSVLRCYQRQFDLAIYLAKEAECIYRSLGDNLLIAQAILHQASPLIYTGDAGKAAQLCREAIALLDEGQDPQLFLTAHHNLVRCYIDLGSPEEALATHFGARELYQKHGDPLVLLRATWQEGQLLREIGHLNNAEAALLRARKGFLEQGLGFEVALVSLDLADLYLKTGNLARVRQTVAEAVPLFRSLRVGREMMAALLQFQQAAEQEEQEEEAG